MFGAPYTYLSRLIHYVLTTNSSSSSTRVVILLLAATREYHGTFRSPSSASRTKVAPAERPDIIMTLVSYFCGLPGVPRKARKHWHYQAGFALIIC